MSGHPVVGGRSARERPEMFVEEALLSEADLMRRLAATLRLATSALDALAPNGYFDDVDSSMSVPFEKLAAESAILILSAARVSDRYPELRRLIDQVARQLESVGRSAQVMAGIYLEPVVALDHACVHLCLSAAGYPHADLDQLLRAALDGWVGPWSRERSPHRELEQAWLRRLLGDSGALHASLPADALLVAASMLARPLDVLCATRDDGYALTHAVMFSTDLGAQRIQLPRPASVIVADLDCLLALSLDRLDYDLAAEALFCWPMLGLAWTQVALLGYRVLLEADDAAGFLPTPVVDLARHNVLAGTDQKQYAFAAAYHTVYAMGLLCAATLSADDLHIAPIRYPPNEAADALLPFLLDEPVRPWITALLALSGRARSAFASLLLTVALRRAIDARNLSTVAQLLKIASRYELAAEPAAVQAAELLARANVLVSSLGLGVDQFGR